jgi:transposase-like protein
MKRKVVTIEIKNEIVKMTKEGYTVDEICAHLGVSSATIYRVRKESGLSHMNDKGGKIAKTIPVTELEKPVKAEKVEEDIPPVLIADQAIEICGTETLTTYKAELKKDSISVSGDLVIGEIKIDKILDLANELKGVYNLVTRMKGNRFGLME